MLGILFISIFISIDVLIYFLPFHTFSIHVVTSVTLRESFTLPHLFQSESGYSSKSDWNFRNSVDIFYYVFYTI
jgi:hypothetical protein